MNRPLRYFIFGITALFASTAMADVTFFESENFGGRQFRADRSVQNLTAAGFNDRAHSAIIDGGSWEVCVNSNFDGGCTILVPGRYPTLGEWSGRISSARPVGTTPAASIPAGPSIRFFETENFGGRNIAVDRSQASFGALGFDRRARSAIIEDGSWEVCADHDFGGGCTILAPGRYPILDAWSGRISSARPVGMASVNVTPPIVAITLFETENFGGRNIAVDRSQASFGALGFDRRARSAIIEGRSWEVCADRDFGGGCTILAPGRYPILDTWAGRISSVRPTSMPMGELRPPAVAERPKGGIIFFESENFGGRKFIVDEPDRNFAGSHASDRAQSAIVEGSAWELCTDADFRGGCRVLVPGRYPELGGLSGHIRSVRPSYDQRDGMRSWASATLFSGPNLTGRSFRLGGEGQGNLNDLFNERASSLRVERGYWIFCSDADFRGECRTFGPGEYAQLPPAFDNRISSGRRISNDYPYADSPSWR